MERDAVLVFVAQLAGLKVCWLGSRHGLDDSNEYGVYLVLDLGGT